MMKVYLVTKGSYSDYHIEYAFLDREMAAAYVERHNALLRDAYQDDAMLEEWDVQESMPNLSARYSAFTSYDGAIVLSAQVGDVDTTDLPPVREVLVDDGSEWPTIKGWIHVEGTDAGRVLKAARDRDAQLKAQQQGL